MDFEEIETPSLTLEPELDLEPAQKAAPVPAEEPAIPQPVLSPAE